MIMLLCRFSRRKSTIVLLPTGLSRVTQSNAHHIRISFQNCSPKSDEKHWIFFSSHRHQRSTVYFPTYFFLKQANNFLCYRMSLPSLSFSHPPLPSVLPVQSENKNYSSPLPQLPQLPPISLLPQIPAIPQISQQMQQLPSQGYYTQQPQLVKPYFSSEQKVYQPQFTTYIPFLLFFVA